MADTSLIFVGIKIDVRDDELELLERRSHPAQRVAMAVGLDHYWGNFSSSSERYCIYVGRLICKIGCEDQTDSQITIASLAELEVVVSQKLQEARIEQPPLLHLAYQPDP